MGYSWFDWDLCLLLKSGNGIWRDLCYCRGEGNGRKISTEHVHYNEAAKEMDLPR